MSKKKSKKSARPIIEINCSECGRVTKHYLSKDGDYKCLFCGKINRSLPRKKEVIFEQNEDFFDKKEEVVADKNTNVSDNRLEGSITIYSC